MRREKLPRKASARSSGILLAACDGFLDAFDHQADIRRMGEKIADLPHSMGAAVQIDRDMIYVARRKPASRRQ